MSNKMRHVYGYADPQPVNVEASQAVSVGDVMVKDNAVALPASSIVGASAAAVQESVHDIFIGVSADQRQGNDATAGVIVVDTLGTYKFDCDALGGPLDQGTFFGVAHGCQWN